MVNKKILIFFLVLAFNLSTKVNAAIFNTLEGVDYEWLELSVTQGMSRNEVEMELANTNSALYGYRYASRAEVASLLISYTGRDISGYSYYTGKAESVDGAAALFADFGATYSYSGNGVARGRSSNVGWVEMDGFKEIRSIYGAVTECNCWAYSLLEYDLSGAPVLTYIDEPSYNVFSSVPRVADIYKANIGVASYLVKYNVSAVPVPASFWLFVSGLIGLYGAVKRKT